MNKFKEALEEIRNGAGDFCENYETCEHVGCKSSYTSWSIADKVLTEYSDISSSFSRSKSEPEIEQQSFIYPLFKIIVIGVLIICFAIGIFCISEINYHKKWINKNSERINKLEKIDYIENIEFDLFKKLTSNEFEKTWRSFGIIRNNFLALGTGFHLGEKDIIEDENENENENDKNK
jgi:hypothetical protein